MVIIMAMASFSCYTKNLYIRCPIMLLYTLVLNTIEGNVGVAVAVAVAITVTVTVSLTSIVSAIFIMFRYFPIGRKSEIYRKQSIRRF